MAARMRKKRKRIFIGPRSEELGVETGAEVRSGSGSGSGRSRQSEVSWENYGEECRRLWSARSLDVAADGGLTEKWTKACI
jgi:hypothetical protein